MNTPNQQPIFTASELGDYAYCAKAWYLKRAGYAPQGQSLDEGEEFHLHKDQMLEHSLLLRKAGWFCAVAAVMLLVGLTAITFLLRALR